MPAGDAETRPFRAENAHRGSNGGAAPRLDRTGARAAPRRIAWKAFQP
ncbi:MAG: hypothetical protein ABW032_12755 [Burkholderiaceae bacterium]